MKKRKVAPLYIGTRLVIVLCCIFMLVAWGSLCNRAILKDKLNIHFDFLDRLLSWSNPGAEAVGSNEFVTIDWENYYPFQEEETVTASVMGESSKKTAFRLDALENYENKIVSLEAKVEDYYDRELFMRTTLLEQGAFLADTVQWEISEKVKDKPYIFWNGREGHISRCVNALNVSESAGNVADFAKYVEAQGIPFLYVQFPCKMSNMDAEDMPEGYESYADENVADFLGVLESRDVDYLDFTAKIEETGQDMFSLFFRTDHHWTPKAGLWAAGVIAEQLEEYDIWIDETLLDTENYQTEVYENIYLGTYGRAVTQGVTAPDDLEIITPIFDTELSIQILGRNVDKTGDFSETFIDWGMMYPQPSYEITQYSSYMWGDDGLMEIENHKADNDKKILIIKDSFANVVSPYLALGVKETSIIDLRVFTGSLHTYIEEYEPDMVLVCYNPGSYAGTGNINYSTHKSTMDFR